MARLSSFMTVSLDGYFADANGDMRWAHNADPEFNEFVAGNARSGGVLVFGRVTYQMMAGYWPSPTAAKNDPVVAERMNALPKVVFSRTLTEAPWHNTKLVTGDLLAEVRKLKDGSRDNMVILGSGSLVKQLAEAGLIDELQIVVAPIALGDGKKYLGGIRERLPLRLMTSRAFGNGSVFLRYEPRR